MEIQGAVAEDKKFTPGDKVFHQVFGNGQVVDACYSGETPRLRVAFEEEGEKWLVVKYARLMFGHQPCVVDQQEAQILKPEPVLCLPGSKQVSPHIDVEQGMAAVPPEVNPSRRRMFKSLAGLVAAIPLFGAGVTTAKPAGRAIKILETRIAGFAHYQGHACQARIQQGEELKLKRQPANTHDQKAIEVFWYGHKLGYVPRRHNAALSQLMDKHEIIRAQVTAVDYHSQWEPVEFEVEVWV